jgi:hypothetical protein
MSASFTASSGSCRRGCRGSACPSRQRPLANRPCTIGPSPKSWRSGPLRARWGRRWGPGCGIARLRSPALAVGGRVTRRTPGPKRGAGLGCSGDNHQKGEKGIAIRDNPGDVFAPVPGAPVHETALVLCPEGLNALQQMAQEGGWDLQGADRNLDGGVDATHPRQGLFPAGLLPPISAHPRHRKRPQRGRQRFFSAAIQALRMRVARTCAWEDRCKRLWRRFDRIQQRHYGMKWLAYMLINLRAFCGV